MTSIPSATISDSLGSAISNIEVRRCLLASARASMFLDRGLGRQANHHYLAIEFS